MVFCLHGFKHGHHSLTHIFLKWAVHFNACVLSFDFGEGFTCRGRIESHQVRDACFVFNIVSDTRWGFRIGLRLIDLLDDRFRIFQQGDHVFAVIV
ncbi:Uncharacterised protein [Vibrio cholerae]|nr:Uncharacterised protein [Vibrio cholerae]